LRVIENVTFLSELNRVSFLYSLLPSHGFGCWDFSRCNFVWFVWVGNMSWCSFSLECWLCNWMASFHFMSLLLHIHRNISQSCNCQGEKRMLQCHSLVLSSAP
jgi:hypothetical protein